MRLLYRIPLMLLVPLVSWVVQIALSRELSRYYHLGAHADFCVGVALGVILWVPVRTILRCLARGDVIYFG